MRLEGIEAKGIVRAAEQAEVTWQSFSDRPEDDPVRRYSEGLRDGLALARCLLAGKIVLDEQ